MSARSNFVPGALISVGDLGAATIYDGISRPTSSKRQGTKAVGVLRPSEIGLVLNVVDDQYLLVVVGTTVGIVMIAEVKLLS